MMGLLAEQPTDRVVAAVIAVVWVVCLVVLLLSVGLSLRPRKRSGQVPPRRLPPSRKPDR